MMTCAISNRFVFEGLEMLMEQILVSESRYIRFANIYGIRKILRNVLALRQNIKTMSSWSPNTEFKRTREFYGLFSLGPQVRFSALGKCLLLTQVLQALLENVRQEKRFAFEEYQAMLNLQCGVDQAPGQAGPAQTNDRDYAMYIIELQALELEQTGTAPKI